MQKTLGFILLIFILFGILLAYRQVDTEDTSIGEDPNLSANPHLFCEQELIFKSIEQGNFLDKLRRRKPNLIIADGWNQIEELNRLMYKNFKLKLISYLEEVLVAASLGAKPQTGFAIKVEKVCRKASTIIVIAHEQVLSEHGGELVTYPYQIISIVKESPWNQDIDFILSLDGQHVFTQTHYISEPRRWHTLDQTEGQ